MIIFVELDSEIVAVDADFGIIEHCRREIPGSRHVSLQDQDLIEAVAALPDQRDTKAMPSLGHETVLPGRIALLENDVHGISRPSPLIIDLKAGDATT